MKRATSLYLDLARFVAAAAVFVNHLSFSWFTGGFLWQAAVYAQNAVAVFFVLSGFVIAHVLATREQTPRDFAASRFARLYSVVLPSLLLTVLCTTAIKGTDAFTGEFGANHYLATLFMANRWWFARLDPPFNPPFWSLSFEAAYYILIGILVFSSGLPRILAAAGWALVVGPAIIAMAPLWFIGFGAFHVTVSRPFSRRIAHPLWFLSSVLLLFCWRLPGLEMPLPPVKIPFVSDYAVAVCFAVNIIAFNSSGEFIAHLLTRAESTLRWLGALTFALYLFNYPLLEFFANFAIGSPSSWQQRLWLIGATFLVVTLLAPLCDWSKPAYKRTFIYAASTVRLYQLRWLAKKNTPQFQTVADDGGG